MQAAAMVNQNLFMCMAPVASNYDFVFLEPGNPKGSVVVSGAFDSLFPPG
jgi:hypothetical protein